MKNILIILIFSLLSCVSAFAKWKYNVGDVVYNEVLFGKKEKFKLPPGKFTVGVVASEREFRDIMLYQIDEKSGYLRWAIHFFATGNTQWDYWNPPKFCDRTNVYFIKKFKGNKNYACWMVNHSRSDIGANKGFWAKVREYEINQKIKTPDIFVYSKYEYSKGPKLWGFEYYYNPELDGVPKPVSKEWNTSEFHKQRVMDYPKHEAFLKKYISYTAKFVDDFNKMKKIKNSSKLSLKIQENLSQSSINIETNSSQNNSTSDANAENNIIKQIKELKKLYDDGAITKEEFDKAKKVLLN